MDQAFEIQRPHPRYDPLRHETSGLVQIEVCISAVCFVGRDVRHPAQWDHVKVGVCQ